jgi:peroxiredoxin Q/BCP
MAVAEGQPAPDFALADQDGSIVRLSSLRGAPVVLYFYPRDNTPGCTTEACAFRDARAAYAKAGAQVVGISPDSVASHRKFADKFELPFRLLSDPDRTACQAFGVWKEKTLYGKTSMGVERTTFVIDAGGTIRKIFAKVKVAGHAEAVLSTIKELQQTARP